MNLHESTHSLPDMKVAQIDGQMNSDRLQIFEQAKARMADCDSIVILMQGKDGELFWFSPGYMRLDTVGFLVQKFLHKLMRIAWGKS